MGSRQGHVRRMFVGTYADPDSPGIHVFAFNESDGSLQKTGEMSGIKNPSFLAVHPDGSTLYTISEIRETKGKVVSIRIAEDGNPVFLNERETAGSLPCHVTVDPSGKYILVANYLGGNVMMYSIDEWGEIGELTYNVRHQGSSVNPQRQNSPHPHSVHIDPKGEFAYVPDLGADRIFVYLIDRERHKLREYGALKSEPGAGPRHCVLHPEGLYLYVANELDSTVSVFSLQGKGERTPVQTVSSLPSGFSGTSYVADIHFGPSVDYLYASNRGHDSLAVYQVDAASGRLTLVCCLPAGGKTPRNFAVSPGGKYLLAAHQDSDTIAVFEMDHGTGGFTGPMEKVRLPKPVCIQFG